MINNKNESKMGSFYDSAFFVGIFRGKGGSMV